MEFWNLRMELGWRHEMNRRNERIQRTNTIFAFLLGQKCWTKKKVLDAMMDKKESFGWGDNILFGLLKKERKHKERKETQTAGVLTTAGVGGGHSE